LKKKKLSPIPPISPIRSPYVDILPAGGSGELAEVKKRPLFVLGGRSPDADWLHAFAGVNARGVWAVDSGASACRAADVEPSVVVGDRDSASREDWQWAVSVGAEEHLHDSAKDLTDFQLALALIERANGRTPLLTGCFGGRADHFLSILQTFYGFSKGKGRARCMIDDVEGIFLLYSRESAALRFRRLPVAVSLLSMSGRCRGVSISGVRWPLSKVELKRKFPWSISNEAEPDEVVSVSCGEGALAVYWCYCR
jgi:thiamine pyrophosphokinase